VGGPGFYDDEDEDENENDDDDDDDDGVMVAILQVALRAVGLL
jgi:hypothetical protein